VQDFEPLRPYHNVPASNRAIEANGIVVDQRHATTPVVQLRSKRTAPATEQNDIRCTFEHPHHETHIVETRRPAGEDVIRDTR